MFPVIEQGGEVVVMQLNAPCIIVLIFMLLENALGLMIISHGMKNSRCFHFILRENGTQPDLLYTWLEQPSLLLKQ